MATATAKKSAKKSVASKAAKGTQAKAKGTTKKAPANKKAAGSTKAKAQPAAKPAAPAADKVDGLTPTQTKALVVLATKGKNGELDRHTMKSLCPAANYTALTQALESAGYLETNRYEDSRVLHHKITAAGRKAVAPFVKKGGRKAKGTK